MKVLKSTNNRAERWREAYERSEAGTIFSAYIKPSAAKVRAAELCLKKCRDEGGSRFRIIAAGSSVFTAAWRVAEGIRVETRDNSYLISDNPWAPGSRLRRLEELFMKLQYGSGLTEEEYKEYKKLQVCE